MTMKTEGEDHGKELAREGRAPASEHKSAGLWPLLNPRAQDRPGALNKETELN